MSLYESDHTKFMRELFEKNPKLAEEQKKARPLGGTRSQIRTSARASRKRPYRRKGTSISENKAERFGAFSVPGYFIGRSLARS